MKEEASAAQAGDKRQGGNGAGLKVAAIVASVVAVCGISFGVYGMIQSAQKEKQFSNLKVQIKKDDGTTTTVETPKIETKTDDGTTITITDTPAEKVNTKEYIYIGEWGLKVKLPEGLHEVEYSIHNPREIEMTDPGYVDSEVGASSLSVKAWRNAKDSVTYSSAGPSCNNAIIVRVPKGKRSSDTVAFSKGDYDYFFAGWHAVCDDREMPAASRTAGDLRKALTDPDNYSEI